MTTEHKILVFPAGTEIAFEIHNALRNNKIVELYGATSVPCHANLVFENCVDGLPYANDPLLIDALNVLIDKWGIEFVYPAHDDALLRLTEDQDKLHAKVITSTYFTVSICRSKAETYFYLRDAWYMPGFYRDDFDIKEFPVFLKPAVGQGSTGTKMVTNRDQLWDFLRTARCEYVMCEYLPGAEYTVDCFTDRHGVLRFVGQRTRERIRSGIAVRSRLVITEDAVMEIADSLNARFDFNGAWFFQLKEDKNGELKLLEVAPRIAGTMGLTRNIGVNLPLLTLYNNLGMDVEIIKNPNELLLDRAFISRFQSNLKYENVYVDLDDTLIVKGKVNVYLLAFLYQCRDKGKKLILLTKHAGNAIQTLDDHSIDMNLFDSIINIPDWAEKYQFIRKDSIFIDDSFAERKAIHEAWGIPVFDTDAVECLMDWRG